MMISEWMIPIETQNTCGGAISSTEPLDELKAWSYLSILSVYFHAKFTT